MRPLVINTKFHTQARLQIAKIQLRTRLAKCRVGESEKHPRQRVDNPLKKVCTPTPVSFSNEG
jgi:hypothetical protein